MTGSDLDLAPLLGRLVRTFPGMAYRCLHDADWTLEFVSDGAEELLGYTPHQLVNDVVVAVSDLVHPDDLAKVSLEVEKGLSAREPFGCIYRMRTRGGAYKWISEVGRGVFDAAGNLEAIEGFLSDVTKEIEGVQAARTAERRAIVTRMASGIAHDFNNILTGILGSVDEIQALLDDPPPTGGARDTGQELGTMRVLVGRASALTQKLLRFGRPGSARTDPIDLAEALRGLEALLARVLDTCVEITVRVPDTPLWCRIDPVELEQVVINLAVNARDAMPGGGRLDIALERQGGDMACLRVADTGNGIEPSALGRVFEPYFTTKGLERGTGLGLATVQSIVQGAGGDIGVRSTPGQGTTFEITLPLHQATNVGVTEQPVGSEVILYAEDDEEVRGLIARGLRRLGYTVLEASNGEQALQISARHKGPLDLLLTDGGLPKLGGIELAKQLCALRPSLVAILVTGDQATGPPGLFALQLDKPLTSDEIACHARRVLRDRA